MPKTCGKTHVSVFRPPVKPTGKMPNLIQLLFSPYQRSMLTKMILDSMNAIAQVFFQGQITDELASLTKLVQTGSHTEQLAVFFLLLNVDQGLKLKVMELEVEANQKKLERFLLDLRRILVMQFSLDENMTLVHFVEHCEEYWVLA